jgi:hypothetical protein
MKTLLKISMMVLFVSFLFGESIILPNNSVIPVKTVDQLSSDKLTTGQEVILYVAADVKIKGETVITSGTPVYGMVQESKNAQMAGISGKILISIRSTVAVDGTNILLSGQFSDAAQSEVGGTVAVGVILCPLALLNTGEDGIIPVGAQIRTMTVGAYEIVLDK